MGEIPFFSIIMPVYGVEKYLRTAIDSVLAQSFDDFELILVDDCSPDSSGKICDEYASVYKNIRVIHLEKNGGLSNARNQGLDVCRGNYVIFMDSDDLIEPNLLEKAKAGLEEDTQILVFGVKRFYENAKGETTKTEYLAPAEVSAEGSKGIADAFVTLNHAKVFPFAWNKVYKHSFLSDVDVHFENTKLIEDFLFNIDLFGKAKFVKVIGDCLYCYRKPAHETLVSAYSPDFFHLCKRKYKLEKEFLEKTNGSTFESTELIFESHIKHLISVFLRNRSPKAALTAAEQKRKIKEILNDEVTVEVLSQYQPRGIKYRIIGFILKRKMINACYLLTLAISYLQNNAR